MSSFGPFYWPWRLLGPEPDSAFQGWVILVAVANYAAAFAFLRLGLRSSLVAASLGAYLTAYGASKWQ